MHCRRWAAKGRWHLLAYVPCPCKADGGTGAPPWAWVREDHEVVYTEAWASCSRCHGRVPKHRRAAFLGRRCPVRVAVPLWPPEDLPADLDLGINWGLQVALLLGMRRAGLLPRTGTADAPALRRALSLLRPSLSLSLGLACRTSRRELHL